MGCIYGKELSKRGCFSDCGVNSILLRLLPRNSTIIIDLNRSGRIVRGGSLSNKTGRIKYFWWHNNNCNKIKDAKTFLKIFSIFYKKFSIAQRLRVVVRSIINSMITDTSRDLLLLLVVVLQNFGQKQKLIESDVFAKLTN